METITLPNNWQCHICKKYAPRMDLHYQVDHPDSKVTHCAKHGFIQPDDICPCDIPL